ncbi:Domain of uncharacterised function (DUF1996) [Serratia quinivorans]|uniref:CBM96 family carbohydrate-binding protein n=1 Tax=Serratia quinivorans TaxID=137545 RepID=UPI0021794BA5|nr:DUF1996 domain-containing protein [Serratia quinivorans]CAI1809926.1 Domain of uncharacterised function (DUF1996) [Serratia quinivorans]
MKFVFSFLALAVTTSLFSQNALATSVGPGSPETNVICNYSHTKPDDAIMMLDMPGMAMLHDFFGNIHTDAFTKTTDLQNQPENTCDNQADSSAYWVPALRLEDGTIVKPSYQKTYYQSENVEEYPLSPLPQGLELLAGNHRGTGPTPWVLNYYCKSSGYSQTPFSSCAPYKPGIVQFNIGLRFPDCWDGVTLKAKPKQGIKNAVYSTGGVCSVNYPVKIPRANMNVAYEVNTDNPIDMTKIQLSLDPVMENGKLVEKWGSIYTAHGDFMNGWSAQSAQYMTEHCMNRPGSCNKNIPFSYSTALEDTTIANLDDADKNFADDKTVRAQGPDDRSTQSKRQIGLIKFKLPEWAEGKDIESATDVKYFLRNATINGSDQTAGMMYYMPVSNSWRGDSVTWNNAPECGGTKAGQLYLDNELKFRYTDVDKAVRHAIKDNQTEISFCIIGNDTGRKYVMDSSESRNPPILMLRSVYP